MKKLLNFLLPIIICWSCTTGEDPPVDTQVALKITTGIATRTANVGIKSGAAFTENGEELGLHVTNGTFGTAYEAVSSNLNVKFTYSGTAWLASPNVYLSDAITSVYAYYPYASIASPAVGIPVIIPTDAAVTKDYMFANNASDGVLPAHTTPTASRISPAVVLTMNHALTQVVVKMVANAGVTNVKVVSVGIQNGTGTALKSDGTMAITTGAITSTSTTNLATTRTLSTPTLLQTTPSVDFPIIVIPASITAAGQLQFVVTLEINSMPTYTVVSCDVPLAASGSSNWDKGKTYTYTITSMGGAVLQVSSVVITDWTTGYTGPGINI